jgi:alkanesulfonate monooxygenase SsuD/methylene tetrahydromethanopterin reductase-like flavin-dependent oxidoreductase (luciferase family)
MSCPILGCPSRRLAATPHCSIRSSPLHQPLALAKRVASIDRVSNGRFLFGVGVGYLRPEFEALGAPFDHRGERTDECLDAMEAIWTSDTPTYRGRHIEYGGVRAEPRPMRSPGPPLHVGGAAANAFRRAVTRGHGWYGWALDLAAAEKAIGELRRIEANVTRPTSLPPIEISVTPHHTVVIDEGAGQAFAELGVTRLILTPPRAARHDIGALVRFVEETPGRLVLNVPPV